MLVLMKLKVLLDVLQKSTIQMYVKKKVVLKSLKKHKKHTQY